MILEQSLRILLEWYYQLSQSYGIAIILLSASVSIIMLPLFWIAEKLQYKDRKKKEDMKVALDEIKDLQSPQERHFYTKEIYTQHNYHPANSLVGLVGLAIQIPFFIAAYRMIGHYVALDGESFWLINNLYVADTLLNIGGMKVNLLPFIMTGVNLLAGYMYMQGRNRSEQRQLAIISALFLVLLYGQSSALVLYWTMNNVFSIGKNYLLHRIMTKSIRSAMPLALSSNVFAPTKIPVTTPVKLLAKSMLYPTARSKKTLFIVHYLYNPVLLVFLLLLMFAQAQGASYVSNEASKQALAFVAVFVAILHVVLSVYNIAVLRTHRLLLIASLGMVVAAAVLISNVSVFIPTNFVGEGMAALVVLQLMGMALMFLPLLRHVFCTSLKDIFMAIYHANTTQNKHTLNKKSNATKLGIYILSLVTLAIITYINNPLLIFNTDSSYFSYPFLQLLPSLLIRGMLVTLLCALLYFIKPIRTILVYGAFIAMCMAWISAYLYTPYIGIMEGMTFRNIAELYRNIGINIVELLASISLLIVLVLAVQKKTNLVMVCNVVLLAIICFASIQNYSSSNFSKNSTRTRVEVQVSPPPQHVSTLSFSKQEENIIVVLFDGFVGPLATKIFREHPEIAQEYEGFRYYRNTVSNASYTFAMLLAMLKGKEYLPDNYNANKAGQYTSIQEAYSKAYAFLPKLLYEQEGYTSYLHDVEGADSTLDNEFLTTGKNDQYYNYWKQEFAIASISIDKEHAANFLLLLSIFKNFPYWAKPLYYKFLKLDGLLVPEQAFDYASRQLPMLQLLPSLANTQSRESTYKFFHFFTSHGPYSIDKNLQLGIIYDKAYTHSQGASHYYHLVYSLQKLGLWLDWLQAQGIYNNTKIILVSDHGFNEQSTDGDWWQEVRSKADKGFSINKGTLAPLLLVKDFNSTGKIAYDNTPMTNSDLPYLVSDSIPNADEVRDAINSTRTHFTYTNVTQVSDYMHKQYFEIDERAEIHYDENSNRMYYKIEEDNEASPIFTYGEE